MRKPTTANLTRISACRTIRRRRIHGTADTDVPFEQSELMAQEFMKHGVAFQFHQIANAEHGLAGGNPDEIASAQSKAFDFVKLHLERP